MAWKLNNDKPIFQQLTEIIIFRIISGQYTAGEKLSTVRDLAIEAGVNPNTMQRALSEAENTGIVSVKRGDGRYVTEDEEIIAELKNKYVLERVCDFIESLKSMGLDERQIQDTVVNNILNKGLN